MFTSPAGWVTRLSAGAWLRRITAVLAVVTGGVLAWAAAVPAASAATILIPEQAEHTGPSRPRRAARSRVIRSACPAGRSPSSPSPPP
jgi:hypothetical protein